MTIKFPPSYAQNIMRKTLKFPLQVSPEPTVLTNVFQRDGSGVLMNSVIPSYRRRRESDSLFIGVPQSAWLCAETATQSLLVLGLGVRIGSRFSLSIPDA